MKKQLDNIQILIPISKYISSHKKLTRDKFIKLLNRSNQNVKNGRFDNLAKRKIQNIYKRLNRYAQQLSLQLRWTAAGFAIIAATSISAFGQSFEKVSDTSSPFIFYDNPLKDFRLVGGSSVSFGDIDGDGDLDVFLGEESFVNNENVNIYYRENIGDITNPIFGDTLSNPFGILEAKQASSPHLIDFDGDGDLDMFIGEGGKVLKYYENIGSPQSPDFSNPVSNPFGIIIPYDSYQVSPAFTDIDDDGDLDLFLNAYFSNVYYLENKGSVTTPDFANAVPGPFGLTDFGYYINADMTFEDMDGDGDLDFIGGDYFNIVYHENIGTKLQPDFTSSATSNPFNLISASQNDSPKFVDIDNDGDLDCFIGDANGSFHFQKHDGGAIPTIFENSEIHVQTRSAPTLTDIDNDGDLDAFVGNNYGDIFYYKNNGTAEIPDLSPIATKNPFGIIDIDYHAVPTFVDIDNDGDNDLFVGTFLGKTRFFENVGNAVTPNFVLDDDSSPFGLTSVGKRATPAFIDIDDDGDLDVFSGRHDGIITFWENIGDVDDPIFDDASVNPFGFSSVGNYTSIGFVDEDNDGDFDAVIGEIDGSINFFENTGTASSPSFILSSDSIGIERMGPEAKLSFFDMDNDGDEDAILGGTSGKLSYFENTRAVPVSTSLSSVASDWEAFPNPVDDILHIVGTSTGEVKFQFINSIGQVVLEQINSEGGKFELNLSALPKGIYHLLIDDTTNRIVKSITIL